MSIDLKVPEVGESIAEVQVGKWLKAVGEAVRAEEGIVEIETDKISFELPAPVSGVIVEQMKAEGDDAAVGEVIGRMEEREDGPASAPEVGEEPDSADEPEAEAEAEAEAAPVGPRVMPAARRVMAEEGLTDADVEGTGPGGRVLKEDALRAARVAVEPGRAVGSAPESADEELEEAVRMTPLRRRIAERLVQAQQTAALLTTFNEVDMGEVIAARKEYRDTFLEKHGIKLGFMSFFVKAVVDALKLVPQVNAEMRGENIVFKNHYDIGVAVGGGKGLVVPVLRGADRMSFAEVELAIADLATRARENKLELAELSGGTFTISNGGIYGSMLSTPIVNPPQSGILGLHAIQERPVARGGQVVLRPMMYLALTYDHRIVDGREAVTFLVRVKECVEDPRRMLLEI